MNSMPTYAAKVIDFVAEWFADSVLENALNDTEALRRFYRATTLYDKPIGRLHRHLMHEPDQYKNLIANGPQEPLATPLMFGSAQGIRATHFECLLDHASLLIDLSELWKRCEPGDNDCLIKRFGIWKRLVPNWNFAQSLPAKVRRECALANVTLPYYYNKKPSEWAVSVVGSLGTESERALIVATFSEAEAKGQRELDRLIQSLLENAVGVSTPIESPVDLSSTDGTDYESWLTVEDGVVTWNGETFEKPLGRHALKGFMAIWEATQRGTELSPAEIRKAAGCPNCRVISAIFRSGTGERKLHPVFNKVIIHEGNSENTRYRIAEPEQKISFCFAGAPAAHLNRHT